MADAETKVTDLPIHTVKMMEPSEWKCYLFGNTPTGQGPIYKPAKGQEPNWFVRWMMKICLACTWVKEPKQEAK